MPCYHPLIAVPDGINPTGKKHISIIGAAKDPEFVKSVHEDAILIPCGKCTGCRLDRSRAWADRLMIEYSEQKKGVFLTLTIDPEHMVNEDGCIRVTSYGAPTLCVRDTQLYMKRLRQQYSDVKLRFFLCGEYGERTQRSHYHQILFGISKEDIPGLRFYKNNKLGMPMWYSEWFEKEIWKLGFVTIEDVCWENCAYTARYVTKKLNGPLGKEFYGERVPPFCTMSRRPGIAGEFYKRHDFSFDKFYLSSPSGSKEIQTPKYFLKCLERDNPELAEYLKEKRKMYIDDRRLLKLAQTDYSYLEELAIEEEKKKNATKCLARCEI